MDPLYPTAFEAVVMDALKDYAHLLAESYDAAGADEQEDIKRTCKALLTVRQMIHQQPGRLDDWASEYLIVRAAWEAQNIHEENA